MMDSFRLSSRERELKLDLIEVLASSRVLPEVIPDAYEVLSRLLPSDYTAMCVSKLGHPTAYDWIPVKIAPELFMSYSAMVDTDPVRAAVMKRPQEVLRDSEMVSSHEELRSSQIYEHSRKWNAPMERIMAVLLDPAVGNCHGGFMLYRTEDKPFSSRDQALLQHLTPILARTIGDSRIWDELNVRRQLDGLFDKHPGVASIVLTATATEVTRTPHATALLDKWFPSTERDPQGLPRVLMDQFARLVRAGELAACEQTTYERLGVDENLRARFVPLPKQEGRRLWALMLHEVPHGMPVPPEWRTKLTEKEVKVAECVLRAWDNKIIAEHLNIKLDTLKTHLKHIFEKLGVNSRTQLMLLAISELEQNRYW